ncbi:hypothetical protein HN499_01820 [archaeon]|jgi:hypothetical protein|nr:hypothetical protein [archaeon]
MKKVTIKTIVWTAEDYFPAFIQDGESIDSFVRNSDSTQCISITEELDLTETQLIKDLDDHGMDEEIWPDALKRG